MECETQRQRIGTIMRSLITKGRLVAATITLLLLLACFLAGAWHGYDLGYVDGENRANGWWIDKKPTITNRPRSEKSDSISNTIIFEPIFD